MLHNEEMRELQNEKVKKDNLAEQLREARKSRLLPEPSLQEDNVIISVRHPEMGTIRRIFKSTDKMNAVYDWVGGLSTIFLSDVF